MEKQLTRTDYIFMLSFIFMLVCAVGAFFFGMKVGTDRTTQHYSALLDTQERTAKGLPAYDQTYLVSFYHNIYLPYREFQQKWFDGLADVDTRSGSADPASVMKDLARVAGDQYSVLEKQAMPDSSPLLGQAHSNYMKSLKLFQEAAKAFQSKANTMPVPSLLDAIDKDSFFNEAKKYALQAQKDYYDAMVKWNEAVNPNLKGVSLLQNNALSLTEWSQLPLNLKNDYVAGVLLSGKYFRPFNPQDLVFHIDTMINNGQAKKMNAATVPQITEILLGTGAVRQGDFLNGKSKWYTDETLPMLPFFSQGN